MGERPEIDTSVPHSARVWNYLLGGKDNYEVDQQAAEQFRGMFPQIVDVARADRAFLGRSVRYLAGEAGVRQFLDIGTGLPTMDNTHEVAQRAAPDARIVYVDNDPLVLTHARALLSSSPQGACDYIHADLREPGDILEKAAATLDFGKPVAIMLLGIMHFVHDDDEARRLLGVLLDAVPSGTGSSTVWSSWSRAWSPCRAGVPSIHFHSWEGVLGVLAYAPLVAWGPLLAAVTVAYYRRRALA